MDIEKIKERLDIDHDKARELIDLFEGRLEPVGYGSVKKWISQCYSMPTKLELIMEAANEIIGGCGVEYIESVNDEINDPQGLSYVNMGDTYADTVMYDYSTRRFRVCSWGDIVEKHPGRYI